MKKISSKKYLLFAVLIVVSMAGALSGCGRKEYQQVRSEFDRHSLSIGGELQWESCFDWLYFPQDESTNSVKMGYFKQKENSGKRVQTVKPTVNRAVNICQDGDTIEVYHDMLSEEDFFALINRRVKELAEKYPEGEVAYRINGSTGIDQFVQLDAGKEHQLYLRVEDSAYILYAEMSNEKWKNFLEEWMLTFELKWNGLMVMKEGGTVSDAYAGGKMFQCKEGSMRVDGDILIFHAQEDGFYFKMESGDDEKNHVEEVVLRPVDICLEYNSWEEAVSYFEDKYPDIYSLEVYLYGENTLWDSEKKTLDQVFYKVKEPEGGHGFFLWNGKGCEVFSWGTTGYYNMVDTVRRSMDSELEYYGMYGVDYETRRLYMHYHGSAISGTEITYQWTNEMDYEMIKQFHHDSKGDGVQVRIVRYENGKEKVLSDYLYSYEEYLNRGDIWGTYYEDFIWEKEVTDRTTGKKYVIRYAEVFLPEEAEKNKGIYYDGRIFVYDEDTYLVSVGHSEIVSKSSSIAWEDGGKDKEQAVVIHYVDGGEATLYLSGLVRPDYQPAGDQESQEAAN